MIHKFIYDYILQKETNNPNAEINYRIVAQKYNKYLYNVFNENLSMLFGIFILIAYSFPLSINIYKLVKEKESGAKEGMKIMGLNEFNYFFSYFIIYFFINLIYAIFNTFTISGVMKFIEKVYLFLFLFLYGLVIFSLIFFFQSFLEKSIISVIFSLLIYCIMYFLSLPINSNAVIREVKIIFSLLFPPISMQLGINTISNFQINYNQFNKRIFMKYNNISFFDIYILFAFNFILYMFLGFYLQNVIPHAFGIKKPLCFLCTKKFWGLEHDNIGEEINDSIIKNENGIKTDINNINNDINNINIVGKNENLEININNEENKEYIINNISNENSSKRKLNNGKIGNREKIINNKKNSEYFEDEEKYEEYNQSNDVLKIRNIHKIFENGKVALNGISFNLYRNEIFALLGHNGAGKTTIINILTGLYQSNLGQAIFNEYNILSPKGIEKFRKFLGVCPQHDVLFNCMIVEEHLEMFCIFKNVDKSIISSEIEKVIHNYGLEEIRHTIASNLSGGQKRKLSISIAIVGGSSVIFLDEPTSGMDITSRRNLWNILKRNLGGKIIILTTHSMEEASVLGNRIGILSEGNIECIGSPLFLIEKLGKNINLNIKKKPNADNEKIINFINMNLAHNLSIESEVFNEEILFKIPTKIGNLNIDYNWSDFFKKIG